MTTPDIKFAAHASESGHWYDQQARLADGVPYKSGPRKGQMRPPTLRDARELDLAPGVTSIIRCAYAPQLENYKIDQAILAALTLPRAEGEDEAAWLKRVKEDAAAAAAVAREEGTRIHAAIQAALAGDDYDPAYERHAAKVSEILDGLTGDWIIDWKGKDGTQEQLDRLGIYESQWMQLAATEQALLMFGVETGVAWVPEVACVHPYGYGTKADVVRLNGGRWPEHVRFGIGYVSRDNHGAATLVEVPEDKIEQGWAMFKGQLAYWQAKNQYRPAWAEEM